MEFEQDEPPYFPGEEGNDPFERSKFALAHIWHEVRIRTKLCLKDRKRWLTDPCQSDLGCQLLSDRLVVACSGRAWPRSSRR